MDAKAHRGRPFSEQKREALSRTLFYLAPRSRPVICSARDPEIQEITFDPFYSQLI